MPKNLGKLLALRDWVSLEEAACHFGKVLETDLSEAEVLRWGIEGRLRLSIYFVNHVWVKAGKIINLWRDDDLDTGDDILDELHGDPGDLFRATGKEWKFQGMARLMMTPAVCSNLRRMHSELTQGPRTWVTQHPAGVMIQLPSTQPHEDFETPAVLLDDMADGLVTAQAFSDEWKVVVGTNEIKRLENNFVSSTRPDIVPQTVVATTEKPLQTRERNSLLTVIAALCHYSDIDTNGKNTVSQVTGLIDEIGANLSDDTVRNIIKQTRDLMGTLKK